MPAEDFEYVAQVGQGSYATVYKVRRKRDQKVYAMKRMELATLRPKQVTNVLNETQVLANLDHPRIVKTYEAWMEDTILVMILEFCGGQDLKAKVRRYRDRREYMDERVIWVYLIEALEGLHFLHENDVLHRDLKPANCFLAEDWELKIGDFNTSKYIGQGVNAVSTVGTPLYMSPEVWDAVTPYSSAADIWSLGCLIYELVALRPPFSASKIPALKAKIKEGKFKPLPPYFSEDLKAIITSMLQLDPSTRPTAAALLEMPCVVSHSELIRPQHRLLRPGRGFSATLDIAYERPRGDLTARTVGLCLPCPNYPEEEEEEGVNEEGGSQSTALVPLASMALLSSVGDTNRDISADSGVLTDRLRDDENVLSTYLDAPDSGLDFRAPRAGGSALSPLPWYQQAEEVPLVELLSASEEAGQQLVPLEEQEARADENNVVLLLSDSQAVEFCDGTPLGRRSPHQIGDADLQVFGQRGQQQQQEQQQQQQQQAAILAQILVNQAAEKRVVVDSSLPRIRGDSQEQRPSTAPDSSDVARPLQQVVSNPAGRQRKNSLPGIAPLTDIIPGLPPKARYEAGGLFR